MKKALKTAGRLSALKPSAYSLRRHHHVFDKNGKLHIFKLADYILMASLVTKAGRKRK